MSDKTTVDVKEETSAYTIKHTNHSGDTTDVADAGVNEQNVALTLSSEDGYKRKPVDVLSRVVAEALKHNPRVIKSILGPIKSWAPPYKELSEFTITDPWYLFRAINYFLDVNVPAFPRKPEDWVRTFLPPPVTQLFWRPSTYFQQPDPFDSVTSFSDERWFYINGICTNEDVARLNSQLLTEMFYRPVTVIQNMTDSIVVDLWECAIGKAFKENPDLNDPHTMTEPAFKASIALLEAITDPHLKRVVLICHSQGTIIAANVLRALSKALRRIFPEFCESQTLSDNNELGIDSELTETLDHYVHAYLISCGFHALEENDVIEILSKLEIYTFANCADNMEYVASIDETGKSVPYIENFANRHDLVAWLGVLSPLKDIIHIDGPVFEKKDASSWGHLLNQHYLFDIRDYLDNADPDPYQLKHCHSTNTPVEHGCTKPRLYRYYKGGCRVGEETGETREVNEESTQNLFEGVVSDTSTEPVHQ